MPKKWILITGASTGIGRATTEVLSARNFGVYACARKKEDLDNLRKIENVVPIKLDVTNTEDIKLALKCVKNSNTGLFGIVNNAGISKVGPLMELPDEDLTEQFEVNFMGVHKVTKAFFPLVLEAKGRIIMISSDSGFFAAPFYGAYCASKFALEGYSDSLRRELLLYGVKVALIQPGTITTAIWDKINIEEFENKESLFKQEALEFGNYAINKGKTKGLSPNVVAEKIYKALTEKTPKLRYLVSENPKRHKIIKFSEYISSGRIVDNMIKKELEELKKNT
ncbi:MAG: SDR family oxidoreductase [archaeon]|nr:SDR family oxidoreductase [archaeon]